MATTVRARYEHGVLTPLDALDLDEGAVVRVTIDSQPTPRGAAALLKLIERIHADVPDPDPSGPMSDLARTFRDNRPGRQMEEDEERGMPPLGGGLAGMARRVRSLHASMPPDAEDDYPTDFAMNRRHYLYGHPKEEDEVEGSTS